MTKPPNPDNTELGEILAILEGNRIDIPRKKREAIAIRQINALITKARIEATQSIEKDILELIGEDEERGVQNIQPENDKRYHRNKLKSELRLKLKEYIGNDV